MHPQVPAPRLRQLGTAIAPNGAFTRPRQICESWGYGYAPEGAPICLAHGAGGNGWLMLLALVAVAASPTPCCDPGAPDACGE